MVAGDPNTDVVCIMLVPVYTTVIIFIADNKLYRCNLDLFLSSCCQITYLNDSTSASGYAAIDYTLTSSDESGSGFNILDINSKLSDHLLPSMILCVIDTAFDLGPYITTLAASGKQCKSNDVAYYRWDHVLCH